MNLVTCFWCKCVSVLVGRWCGAVGGGVGSAH